MRLSNNSMTRQTIIIYRCQHSNVHDWNQLKQIWKKLFAHQSLYEHCHWHTYERTSDCCGPDWVCGRRSVRARNASRQNSLRMMEMFVIPVMPNDGDGTTTTNDSIQASERKEKLEFYRLWNTIFNITSCISTATNLRFLLNNNSLRSIRWMVGWMARWKGKERKEKQYPTGTVKNFKLNELENSEQRKITELRGKQKRSEQKKKFAFD